MARECVEMLCVVLQHRNWLQMLIIQRERNLTKSLTKRADS